MASSTSNLDSISSGQASKEVTANALFDAGSPATLFGRRASTTSGLSWGYYGGVATVASVLTLIANGVKTLTASATNYIEFSSATGLVTTNTTGFTSGLVPLYSVVVGASTVTSYTDWRVLGMGSGGASGRRRQAVAYAASVTLDCGSYDIFDIGPLTGNIAITFSNALEGQRIEVAIKQDATGGRTITWTTAPGYGSDLTAMNSASVMAPNKTDEYGFRYHADSTTYRMIACARGY